jgi:hypothetical protein
VVASEAHKRVILPSTLPTRAIFNPIGKISQVS